MALLKKYGEMWVRNKENIDSIPRSRNGGRGIYVLYSGSMPVYIGMGKIHRRIIKARLSKRRGKMWDHFSWYIPLSSALTRDIETLLLRMLPVYLRILTRQRGKFMGGKKTRRPKNGQPEIICQAVRLPW
jgi:hypothetical protein